MRNLIYFIHMNIYQLVSTINRARRKNCARRRDFWLTSLIQSIITYCKYRNSLNSEENTISSYYSIVPYDLYMTEFAASQMNLYYTSNTFREYTQSFEWQPARYISVYPTENVTNIYLFHKYPHSIIVININNVVIIINVQIG